MRNAAFFAAVLLAAPLAAQQPYAPARVTAEDYARAERFLSGQVDPLVLGGDVRPVWLDGERFWYRNRIADGEEAVLVDVAERSRERAFDHPRLARALSVVVDTSYGAFELPLRSMELAPERGLATFELDGAVVVCDLRRYRCEERGAPEADRTMVVSPDGERAAFIRDHDLWVRELATGEETRLTFDGEEHFGYATNNAGWTKSERPVVRWSPDSRKLATFRHDARGVGNMYLVTTNVGHPELEAWRYPLPEDTVIFRIHRLVADLDAPADERVVWFDMPADPHRSTVCDHVYCGGTFADVEWSADAARVAFVSSSRDHKRATLRVADAATGAVRDILEEAVETFFESGYRTANWRFLPASEQVIWYSRRDDWGHLYLYDLDGRLEHRITEGDWNVLQVLEVDEDERTITFLGNEREPGDPYFQYLYRIDMHGTGLVLLTPDSANHEVSLSPSGAYFVDSYSTPTTPPVTVVREMDGEVVMEVERADITALVEAGWQPPVPFSVKARDGQTDLYGLLFRPTDFDPSVKYPVVNYIYPGPQSGSVGSRSFRAAHRDHQALAELGFVVVALDAMGTPMRSRSFHEAYYGNMGDNGLPDQMGAIRQLAERHAWIDLDRVGVWGHSGGGFASADAILRYPEFYEVAVSEAGNHDNRNYEDDWGEKWQGLLVENADGTTSYDNQANQLLADNLEGKLLLAHGMLDSNVPPYNTLLVVQALIEANKDFDLLLFPERRHGFATHPYMMRRRWDYFVRHLLGAEPPVGYEIGGAVGAGAGPGPGPGGGHGHGQGSGVKGHAHHRGQE